MYVFPYAKQISYYFDLLLYHLILVDRLYLKDFHQVIAESNIKHEIILTNTTYILYHLM